MTAAVEYMPMRISFDLDDTLILTGADARLEPLPRSPLRWLYRERLRQGAVALCARLRAAGWKVSIYTTSQRSEAYIRRLFGLYGIALEQVVNLQKHEDMVQRGRAQILPSKMPSRFGMDLHVDDDLTVKQNGEAYGFRVVLVDKHDTDWADKVWTDAHRVAARKQKH